MDTAINWKLLGDAVEHYMGLGYRYIELPWISPMDMMSATIESEFVTQSDLGPLVGSAEQSFIAMDYAGELGDGKFVACTPCFRGTDVEDDLHRKTFMKVELYMNVHCNQNGLEQIVRDAYGFFGSKTTLPIVVPTADGFDIEVSGIEVGSYGIRRFEHIEWVYGTGVAEPRFSKAIQR